MNSTSPFIDRGKHLTRALPLMTAIQRLSPGTWLVPPVEATGLDPQTRGKSEIVTTGSALSQMTLTHPSGLSGSDIILMRIE